MLEVVAAPCCAAAHNKAELPRVATPEKMEHREGERLIRVTLQREEFREIARAHSRSPSTTSSSSGFTLSSPIHDRDVSSSGGESRTNALRAIYGSSSNSTCRGESGSTIFTMEEICEATKNFSRSFRIGQGGSATVYKGRLKDGTLVAVKRNKNDRLQYLLKEFRSEIQTLALVEHLNIVKFYGYLEHEDERILVVEHVPNGTLREHLDCVHGNVLDFAVRLDIAINVAHAVTYLHMYTDHPIIHRDIKSSNILLTENLRAKVADFGFARLAADCRRPIETKRDLKERITARWAMKKFSDGDAILTLDPRLRRSPAINFMMEKILEIAFQCLAPHRRNRPTMKKCAKILWSIRKDYKEFSTSDIPSLMSHVFYNVNYAARVRCQVL
ncbi:unnamed protein product [Fraxinus pennsylvanica]|uniref:Protein kinase domain-containing protein n=1 Tax=Fraxinus pennsylvanica TaxID=56036 RepID=A0AAD2E011_9LAMI|nr:unnamed protein product [Fraxinus pennsylvanica]